GRGAIAARAAAIHTDGPLWAQHGGQEENRMAASASRTVDALEVARFDAMAAGWWDPAGEARPLHAMNPVRLGYIRDRVIAARGTPALAVAPLAGVTAVDVGCGGGLLAEPLARMGARVTGIDAAA